MARTVTTTVYQMSELTDAAKANARDWFRETAHWEDWHAFIFEDFARICEILGIRLDTRPVRLLGGGMREDPKIYFSGFWSQGDGACFEGSLTYRSGAHRDIRAYAPEDRVLHDIADRLLTIQRRNFFQLVADCRHSGRYYHARTMSVNVERQSPTRQDPTEDAETIIEAALRDLADWLYRQLEAEYDYQTSDAQVDEAIAANAYEFTEDGSRMQ